MNQAQHSKRLKQARKLVEFYHKDQKYNKDQPYTYHLEKTLEAANRFLDVNMDHFQEIELACLLHDSIEDTAMKYDEIQENFGSLVAELVEAVTDPEGFKNRKERKKAAYAKLNASPVRELALAIKLCDRIANVEATKSENGRTELVEMYRKEQPEFQQACRRMGEYDSMWAYLNTQLDLPQVVW